MPWKPLIQDKDEEDTFGRFLSRTRRTKFLADESLGAQAAELIRREWKANVEFAPDVGLGGRDDTEVFAYAWRNRRVLLTHDRDFMDDRRFPEQRNAGVVVLPGGSGDEHGLIRGLYFAMLLVDRWPESWVGTKVIVQQDAEVRIKQRHARTGAVETTRYRFTSGGPPLIWEDEVA